MQETLSDVDDGGNTFSYHITHHLLCLSVEGVREWKAARSGSRGLGSGGVAATWPTDTATAKRGEITALLSDHNFKPVLHHRNRNSGFTVILLICVCGFRPSFASFR